MAESKITSTPDGFVVHVGYRITLPGVYTNELYAQKALNKYLNKPKQTRKRRTKAEMADG